MKNDLTSLESFTTAKVIELVEKAQEIKANPEKYSSKLSGKTLLSIFEKPSLRTRISFEVGINQLGGKAITLDSTTMPLGKKESIEDTAKVASRYVDLIMARMYKQEDIEKLAQNASVPVINGLTDKYHPCQILSDLLTIKEKKGKFNGLKLAFVGDGNNNVTHSLMLGCTLAGINIHVASPKSLSPQKDVLEKSISFLKNSEIVVNNNPIDAVFDADIVYVDSWFSYHIKDSEKKKRLKLLKPFQVNNVLLSHANDDAIFMNCLPAERGFEQTAEVIDGSQSVVFDQAENRLHMQKAIMLYTKGLL